MSRSDEVEAAEPLNFRALEGGNGYFPVASSAFNALERQAPIPLGPSLSIRGRRSLLRSLDSAYSAGLVGKNEELGLVVNPRNAFACGQHPFRGTISCLLRYVAARNEQVGPSRISK